MNESMVLIFINYDFNKFHRRILNKMKFHPSKTKVLMVSKFKPRLIDILLFFQHYYKIGNDFLDYISSQKELDILMNNTLNFTEQTNSVYSCKANQKNWVS